MPPQPLWEINLGSPVSGFPIAYAVDGRQYVAVSTGTSGTASGCSDSPRQRSGSRRYAFSS